MPEGHVVESTHECEEVARWAAHEFLRTSPGDRRVYLTNAGGVWSVVSYPTPEIVTRHVGNAPL